MAGAAMQQPPMKKKRTIDGSNKSNKLRFFDGFRHKRYNYSVKVDGMNTFATALLSDADYDSRSIVNAHRFPKCGFSSCGMGIIALGGETA